MWLILLAEHSYVKFITHTYTYIRIFHSLKFNGRVLRSAGHFTAAWGARSVWPGTCFGLFYLSHVQLLPIRSHLLNLFANVGDQGWVLILDSLAHSCKLCLHLLKFVSGHLMFELDMLMDSLFGQEREMACKHLQWLERKHVIEGQITTVVNVQVDVEAELGS